MVIGRVGFEYNDHINCVQLNWCIVPRKGYPNPMIPCIYASDSTIIEPLSTHHSGSVMTSFDSCKERGGSGNRSGDHYGGGHYGESRKRRSSEERGVSRDHKRSSYDEVDSGRGGGDDTGYKRRRVLDGGSLGLASKATLNWRQDGEDGKCRIKHLREERNVIILLFHGCVCVLLALFAMCRGCCWR